jgi:hypothetical protein
MEAIGQIDKAMAVAPAAERGHLDRATFRHVPLGCGASMGGIWLAWSASAIHHHRNEDPASLEIRPAPTLCYRGRDRIGKPRFQEVPCAMRVLACQ